MAYDISSPFDPGRRGARFVAADGHGERVGARRQRRQPRLPLVLDAGAALISGEPDHAFEPFARADPAVPVAAAAQLLRRPPGRDRRGGRGPIRRTVRSLDQVGFAGGARRVFTDVRGGIGRGEMGGMTDGLAPREYARLQAQCDQLRGARRTSRVEQIQIASAEVSEAWQEGGQDWVTVYFAASLVDFTVDDLTGAVVEGSKTPQDIEEYWTFTRPVGPKPWRLSAIQTS